MSTLVADMWSKGPVRTWFGNHPKITGFLMGSYFGLGAGIGVGVVLITKYALQNKPLPGGVYFLVYDPKRDSKHDVVNKLKAFFSYVYPFLPKEKKNNQSDLVPYVGKMPSYSTGTSIIPVNTQHTIEYPE